MDFTEQYNTPIPQEQMQPFVSWVDMMRQKTGRDPLRDKYDYDVNGFYLSGEWKNMDERGHGTDRFKKPNHPTFSNESMYHGVDGHQGGEWLKTGNGWSYAPSETNYGFFGKDQLQEYFNQNEPDVKLILP